MMLTARLSLPHFYKIQYFARWNAQLGRHEYNLKWHIEMICLSNLQNLHVAKRTSSENEMNLSSIPTIHDD
jgi:hypothetical protein